MRPQRGRSLPNQSVGHGTGASTEAAPGSRNKTECGASCRERPGGTRRLPQARELGAPVGGLSTRGCRLPSGGSDRAPRSSRRGGGPLSSLLCGCLLCTSVFETLSRVSQSPHISEGCGEEPGPMSILNGDCGFPAFQVYSVRLFTNVPVPSAQPCCCAPGLPTCRLATPPAPSLTAGLGGKYRALVWRKMPATRSGLELEDTAPAPDASSHPSVLLSPL